MDFLMANAGNIIVGLVVLVIIYWAVRQLFSKKSKCPGCSEAAHCCIAQPEEKPALTDAQRARQQRCQYRLAVRSGQEKAQAGKKGGTCHCGTKK